MNATIGRVQNDVATFFRALFSVPAKREQKFPKIQGGELPGRHDDTRAALGHCLRQLFANARRRASDDDRFAEQRTFVQRHAHAHITGKLLS